MGGFPNRPDLATFGPRAVDTRPIRDPSREMTAAQWNLLRFQAAGLGLVSPRAVFEIEGVDDGTIRWHAEAWDVEGGGDLGPAEITRNGAGDYTVAFPATALDESGAEAALAFVGALAGVTNPSPTTLFHAQAGIVDGNPHAVRVCVFNAAGTKVDEQRVTVVVW